MARTQIKTGQVDDTSGVNLQTDAYNPAGSIEGAVQYRNHSTGKLAADAEFLFKSTPKRLDVKIGDKGGWVYNAAAYGVVGDNSTDNYTALQGLLDTVPEGSIIVLPTGVNRFGQTLLWDRRNITLMGAHTPRWYYRGGAPTCLKPTASFTGTTLVHIRDKSLSGETLDNDGGRIKDISIDGNSYGSNIVGLYFEGLVRDWHLDSVDVSQCSGTGIQGQIGAGAGSPRGFYMNFVSAYSNGKHGFRFASLTDSKLGDCLSVDNAERGFYFTSSGEVQFMSCRSLFNSLDGFYIDGSTTMGGVQMISPVTDRNDRNGIRISANGTSTISITNPLCRRDGKNSGSGSETPYSGIKIIGATGAGNKTCPVIIDGVHQIPGVNDDGSGTESPNTGIHVSYSTYVKISGMAWGVSASITDGGNNDNLIIKGGSLLRLGTRASYTDTIQKTLVADEAYGAGWNGALDVPTKNAVYDKIETLSGSTTVVSNYPVGLETFGLNLINGDQSSGQELLAVLKLITSGGVIDKMYTYIVALNGTAPTIEIGIYDFDTGSKMSTGTVTAALGLNTVTLASPITLIKGKRYWFVAFNRTNETVTRFATTSATNNIAYNFKSSIGSSTIPASLPASGSRSVIDRTIFIAAGAAQDNVTSVRTETATYTALVTDRTILMNATSGNLTVNLPTAIGNAGLTFNIRKIDSTANTVTLDGNGSQTIDGSTTKVASTQYSGYTIQSDGANWFII